MRVHNAAMKDLVRDESLCGLCGHAFPDHAVVTDAEHALRGGVVVCPEAECDCIATWPLGTSRPPKQLVHDLLTAWAVTHDWEPAKVDRLIAIRYPKELAE